MGVGRRLGMLLVLCDAILCRSKLVGAAVIPHGTKRSNSVSSGGKTGWKHAKAQLLKLSAGFGWFRLMLILSRSSYMSTPILQEDRGMARILSQEMGIRRQR
eukprot:143586-Amorphochlora_amoeboformis.AAC.2